MLNLILFFAVETFIVMLIIIELRRRSELHRNQEAFRNYLRSLE